MGLTYEKLDTMTSKEIEKHKGNIGQRFQERYGLEKLDTEMRLCLKYTLFWLILDMLHCEKPEMPTEPIAEKLERLVFTKRELENPLYPLIRDNEYYCKFFEEKCKKELGIDQSPIGEILDYIGEPENTEP